MGGQRGCRQGWHGSCIGYCGRKQGGTNDSTGQRGRVVGKQGSRAGHCGGNRGIQDGLDGNI